MFETILAGISYVVNASFFYQAMGTTTAIGIWIGASIYNGDIKDLKKGLIVLGSYMFLIIMTTVPRVLETLNVTGPSSHPGMEYAGMITIAFVTMWYLLGMLIGVSTVQKARRR